MFEVFFMKDNTRIKLDRLSSENQKMLYNLNSMQKKRNDLIQALSLRIIHNLAYKRYFSANKGILERILFTRNLNFLGALFLVLALILMFVFNKLPTLFIWNFFWFDIYSFTYSVVWVSAFVFIIKQLGSTFELSVEASKFKHQDLIVRKALFERKQSVAELISAYNLRLSLAIHEVNQSNELLNAAFEDYEGNPFVAYECLEQNDVDRKELLKINDHLDSLYYLSSGLNELAGKDIQEFIQTPESWAFEQVGGVHDFMNKLINEHELQLYSTGKLMLIDSSMVLKGLSKYLNRNGINCSSVES